MRSPTSARSSPCGDRTCATAGICSAAAPQALTIDGTFVISPNLVVDMSQVRTWTSDSVLLLKATAFVGEENLSNATFTGVQGVQLRLRISSQNELFVVRRGGICVIFR